MEVKTSPILPPKHILADIVKLNEFICEYRFKMGIFLAVNIGMDKLATKLVKNSNLLQNLTTASKIHIISAENSKKVIQKTLADILKLNHDIGL